MTTLNLEKPLTNLQVELLKLYSTDLTDKELLEVSEWLSKFLMKQARKQATKIWDEKGYDEKTVEQILQKKPIN